MAVEAPVITCPLPSYPDFPTLHATPDGPDVKLPWEQIRDLTLWVKAVERWHDIAQMCLDSKDSPHG